MTTRRIKQLLHYGWQHAKQISGERYANTRRVAIFLDILICYIKYSMWSNQYVLHTMDALSRDERERIGQEYLQKNKAREAWVQHFEENRKFLAKWSKFDIEASMTKRAARSEAYRKYYNTGKNLFVEYGVIITAQHYMSGNLLIRDNVLLARNVNIDHTGGLAIGRRVSISEGVTILTHSHDLEAQFSAGGNRQNENDLGHGSMMTPLTIGDFAWIGAGAKIMPGTSEIGRGAIISTNTVISQKIPPYAIVQGFPAKIVGFRMTPEAASEFEQNNYMPDERIPIEVLKANYEKYFSKEKRKEIHQLLKL